jgi:hypothetical protein
MDKPILSLASGDFQKATPHLLPCRINHNGSIEPVEASFWDPRTSDGEFSFLPVLAQRSRLVDGASTVYFRGRKLHGKTVKLPEGYKGVVAAAAPREDEKKPSSDAEVVDLVDEEQNGTPQAALNVQAEFDKMVVWGHEATADATADPYVRGMEEWLTLADQVGVSTMYFGDAPANFPDPHLPCAE